MADKILKSITFPDLPDKYLIPQGTVTEADLEEAEGTKADAIVRSASGDIASYDDGGDLPMKSLKVNIVPKQSGSGDPSPDNVCPISGTDEVGIYKTGVNVWDEEWETGAIDPNSGQNTSSTSLFRTKNYIPIKPNTKYYAHLGSHTGQNRVAYYGENKAYLGQGSGGWSTFDNGVITTPVNAYFMRFEITEPTYANDISINSPYTDTEYHPYNSASEEKSITLPQTVYGGTLDVVSGKLTIDKAQVELNGSSNLGMDTAGKFYLALSDMKKSIEYSIISDRLKSVLTWSYVSLGQNAISGYPDTNNAYPNQNWLYFSANNINNVDDMKTWLTSNPIKAVYPLATPTEIDLTPTEVKSLLGDNNVWSDSGTVEVQYRADTSLVINKILEALA